MQLVEEEFQLQITPFEKNETEFGFDLRMFDNKVSLDATWYDNATIGDIVGVSASATSVMVVHLQI